MLSLRKGMILLLLAKHPFVNETLEGAKKCLTRSIMGNKNNKNKHKAVLFPAGNTISR